LSPLFIGNQTTQGYSWSAVGFTDNILFAQHDNVSQYWIPPAETARPLPGLPSSDAEWDEVTTFADHVLLWKGDRLKWSDVNDFTLYLPVATTAVSAVLTLNAAFIQPPVGGQVTVSVTNPVTPVGSLSLTGSLTFPTTTVGTTSQEVLTIVNTGTAPLNVSGVSLPLGFTGNFVGQIPVGGSQPVLITFAPTAAVDYSGVVSVASDATIGTTTLPITGTGTGVTKIINLSGVLAFGANRIGNPVSSALIIENTGNATLTVSSITLPTGFTGSFSGTVAAGASHIVSITFSPTTAVDYSGTITVNSDATDGVGSISVTGSGVTSLPGTSPHVFMTDNGTCQFGNVQVGNTATGTLRIYNIGDNNMRVVGLALPTGFSGSFSGLMSPHTHQDVTISFSPTLNQGYSGLLLASINTSPIGNTSIEVSGNGIETGKVIQLSGSLDFGDVPVNGTVQSVLRITNVGDTTLTVTSISYPGGFSGGFAGSVAPGATQNVIVSFTPTTASPYSGTLTVNSDATGANTFPLTGTGFNLPTPLALVAGQFVTLTDTQAGLTYYNFYTVVSMSGNSLVLQLMDLTGATPPGSDILADGKQFLTVDANESGETQITGAGENGPIFRVIPMGDYAYTFKERSIQSVQYVGITSGTFFIHNEVSGEGWISRDAGVNRGDGTIIFLGHKELYAYQGGPSLIPVCQQYTRQLFNELDRTRLYTIKVFHNENRHEVWVQYPVIGGTFRVLIWNYIEDTASLDDYSPELLFTGLGIVDWTDDPVWNQFADVTTWATLSNAQNWESFVSTSADHVPLLASQDGNLRLHGQVYSRDGEGYSSLSETMDFDFGDADVFKYVDVVVLGLDVKVKDAVPRTMYVQVGSSASFGESIVWTDPQPILVNGSQVPPIKVNPGGAGRFLRLRFSSQDADVQWRVSSFEIHCRPGNTY